LSLLEEAFLKENMNVCNSKKLEGFSISLNVKLRILCMKIIKVYILIKEARLLIAAKFYKLNTF